MLPSALRRALLSVSCLVLTASVATSQDATSLFQDGIDAYRTGNTQAAAELFKDALALNPGNDEVFRLWQQAEQRVVLEMLQERGEMGELAQRFLGLAKIGRANVASDPGGARDVVQAYLSGDLLQSHKALLELQATFGEWAVPALVGPLGDRADADRRVMAIKALIHLGDVAVPALVQVLHSNDDLTRTNAASTLGTIGDVRAAPALAWMAASDDYDVARSVAASALGKLDAGLKAVGITGQDPLSITHGLVNLWVSGNPSINRPYASGQVAWTWTDGGLQGQPVLGGLYGLLQAEGALHDAARGGAGDAATAGLAAVHAAMKAEIQLASGLEGLDADLLESAQERLPGLELQLALAGPARGDALTMLLSIGQNLAAQALMASMGASAAEVFALRKAQSSKQGEVTLAAALALGGLGQADGEVIDRLGRALTAVPDRMAFSIGATGLSASSEGWQHLAAADVASGLMRVKAFPPKDVVVVQDGVGGVTLDTIVFGLHGDPRTADVPIIVVAASAAEAETLGNRYADSVAAVVAEAASWDDVAGVAGDVGPLRAAAMASARAAALVLSSLPAARLKAVGEHAAQALAGGGDDSVKIAVLELTTHATLDAALQAVEKLVLGGGSTELQIASLNAAARLWAAHGGAQGDAAALRDMLAVLVGDSDSDLALAAARALGQLGAPSPADVG